MPANRLIWTALTALLFVTMPAWAVTLVKDGKPVATIIINREALDAQAWEPAVGTSAKTAAEKIKLAAEDFQRYIEKISGAKLPIVSDEQPAPKDGAAVYIGASKLVEPMKLDIPSGLTTDRKEEGFIIHAEGDTLVLAGNDAGPYMGTYYAVADALNRLGVRWVMPSEFGEVVPKMTTVEFKKAKIRQTPDFLVRNWNGNLAPELAADDALFRLRNKATIDQNAFIAIPGDSYLRNYMPPKEMMKTHPELFAKRLDGTLDEHMISLTSPDAPKYVAGKVIEDIKKRREKNPSFHSLGFAPDDGIPMDLSPEALKQNLGFTDLVGREGVVTELSVSEEWFRFINKVTEEVTKVYPDFIITTNGYTNRTMPPEGVKLHPNVGVMFAAIWADLLHSYDDPKSWQQQVQGQMLERWGKICSRTFVYNYNFPMLVTGLTPMPLTRKIARNTPLMKKWGIIGFEDEQTFPWMAHGITSFYLRARMYWDADTDAKAYLTDYFEKWYGPAAKSSQAYWDAIEEALESTPLLGHEDRILPYVYTDQLLAELEKQQQASEAAAKEEPFATRVRVDRHILNHLKGYMKMNRAEFVGDYDEAIRQADLMFAERTALNHISPYFSIPESTDPRRKYFSGSYYWNLTQRKAHYEKVRDMLTGKTGELVAKAPRKARFAIDDLDVGRYGRWHEPGYDRSGWKLVDTATPFYLQDPAWLDHRGAPYVGYIWYVFELDVPKDKIGKPISVYAPIVASEAWVWVNGEFVGHRPYQEAYIRPAEMKFDATPQIKAGKNVIGVRVSTTLSRVQVSEGFQGPLFLYSPKVNPDEKSSSP